MSACSPHSVLGPPLERGYAPNVGTLIIFRWFVAQKYYVHKICFRENYKYTKVVCPVMWTYDICAFDAGMYCNYY